MSLPSYKMKPVIAWLFTGCVLIYMMVLIGGITRLTHSGLSMVEWNMIVGSLPPMSDADWQEPFEKYKQTPEYKLINNQFSLEEFKSIYWWEYIHRMLGRLIGLVFIVPFLWFLLKRRLSPPLIRNCLVILLLGGFQGVLGWYMVKSGLVKDPHVSHFRLAAHLISAFAVFGFTFWVMLGLLYERESSTDNSLLKWTRIFFAVLIVQILYGAFTAGLHAGNFYNTFPKMGDEWFPDTITAYDGFILNITENKAGVQFVHRYLAYGVALLALFVWNKARTARLSASQLFAVNLLLGAVFLQFLLGVFTIIYNVPLVLGILHQTGAFLLFAATIYLLHRLRG